MTKMGEKFDEWRLEWEGPAIKIWSRPIPGKQYLEYKVCGHYEDIPAIAFFYIQTNLSHRKLWDSSTDEIEFISKTGDDDCDETGLIYWRVNFPRMMAKRDYVCIRRHLVDLDRNVLVLVSKAVTHPDRPVDKRFVRVTDYKSRMVIHPHNSFTQNGFEYIMTYVDDTKTGMPAYALKKLIRNALPSLLSTVHRESKLLTEKYCEFKASEADIESCQDNRVKELHHLIEQAKSNRYYNRLKRGIKCADDKDFVNCKEKGANGSSTPTKINPPEYLPDLSKYAEMIFKHRRFRPIPYKKVHGNRKTPGTEPPSANQADNKSENADDLLLADPSTNSPKGHPHAYSPKENTREEDTKSNAKTASASN